MPLEPLGKIPLMFLSDPTVEIGESGYDTLPWIDGPFRRLCGLEPLQENADHHEDADQQENQCTGTTDGFFLTKEAINDLTIKQREYFTVEVRQKIDIFMASVYKHASQLRRSMLEPANPTSAAKTRKPRKRARVASHGSGEETFVDRVENMPHYKEFNQASLTMLNRRDGPIAHLLQIMKDMDRTAIIAWKNFIYTSQTMPSRTSKKLSQEDHKEQMQKNIDIKKQELNFFNPPAIGKYLDDRLVVRAASTLFGAAAFMPSSEILWDCYAKVTTALIRRAWEKDTRDARKVLKKGIARKENYQKALKEATENPCPRLLRNVSNALKEWKDCAELTGEAEEPAFATESGALGDLWEDLGYSVEPSLPDEGCKVPRYKRKTVRALATKEQMDIAYASYRDRHFSDLDPILTQLTEALEDVHADSDTNDNVAVDLLQGTEGRDLGVDHFARTPLHELIRLFGINRSGALPLVTDSLKITWHQFVGTGTMLQRMFTKSLGDPPTPTLLCDDVGLGKTVQILNTVCMLIHLIELQDAGKSLPPLISELSRPYFAGLEKIPRLPSIIAVPPTLIPQWEEQITRFIVHGSLQVITYASGTYNPVEFFQVGGLWDQYGKGKNCHRTLILVSISNIAQEARKYHSGPLDKSAASREKMFRGDPMKLPHDLPTILNRKFLFFGADEIHHFRNRGWAQLAAQEISANSLVRIGASATPIYTASKDALAAGRLLGYGPMISTAGYELGMAMLQSEQSRRKQINEETKVMSKNGAQLLNDADTPAGDCVAERISKIKAKKHHAFYVQQESIEMVREKLLSIMIRRTGRSQDPDGKPVLDIEPYVESIVWAPPRKQIEAEAFRKHRQTLMLCKPDGHEMEMRVNWKNFLIDDKKVTFHWMLPTWDPTATSFWDKWTKENLEEMASTKILAAVEIVEHYQNPDAKPLFFNEDGTRDISKEEAQAFRPAQKPRKVIIFVMYHIDREMTKKALSVRGIEAVEYDGRMSVANRDAAVHKFENNDSIRVLLMSNVGTTGLNLVAASVLVFLSCLWSGQEEKQTVGRSWRPGQRENVVVHPVIVPGSADVVVSGLAGDKIHMLDYLYEAKAIYRKVFDTYEDDHEETETMQQDKATDTVTYRSKSKLAVRPRKGVAKIEQSQPSDIEDTGPLEGRKSLATISPKLFPDQATPSSPIGLITAQSGVAAYSQNNVALTDALQNASTAIELTENLTPPVLSSPFTLVARNDLSPRPTLRSHPHSPLRLATDSSPSPRCSSPLELSPPMTPSSPRSQLQENIEIQVAEKVRSITPHKGGSIFEQSRLASLSASSTYSNSSIPPWKRNKAEHTAQTKHHGSPCQAQVHPTQRAGASSTTVPSTTAAKPSVLLGAGDAVQSSSKEKYRPNESLTVPPAQFRRKPNKGVMVTQGAITGKRIARSPPSLKRSAFGASVRHSASLSSDAKGKKKDDVSGNNQRTITDL